MKYYDFIPSLILEENEKPPWIKFINGAVLFSDVSGFTPISEKLSKFGAEGAENLTDILNRYFSNMIKIIKENGGQIMKFGGDAIHCFFPFKDSLKYAIFSGISMQNEMEKFKKVRTKAGIFPLSMKIGISYGEVLIGTVGDIDSRCEYIFAGLPVDLSAEAEHYARAGDVIFNYAGKNCLLDIELEEIEKNYYKVLNYNFKFKKRKFEEKKEFNNPYAKLYLIPEIYELVSKGYKKETGALLDVLSMFFQFSGFSYEKEKFDLDKFQEFFLKIIKIVEKYNGRINRISMGDKGSTILFLFGAPNSLEKKEEIGCQFSLELKEMLNKEFPEVKFKIGMNSGNTFSGIVGGSGRFEYTVMGDSVNFSARLMQSAKEFQIITSKNVKEKAERIFKFDFLGENKFKGKANLEKVYSLKDRKREEEFELKEIKLFGRENEKEEIISHLKRASSREAKAFFLEGEAGIGKTHLAEFVLNCAKKENWRIFKEKGEITLKSHPYSVWRKLLEKIFFEKEEIREESIKELLKQTDINFLEFLPIHLEFFGIEKEKIEIDEETKKKLLHHQISKMILKKAKEIKTIIFIDNLQWLDSLSYELLISFLQSIEKEKLFLILSGREIIQKEKIKDLPISKFIYLKELEKDNIKLILEDSLKDNLKENLLDFVLNQTKGNPFYSISFLNHLKENQIIEKQLDGWAIRRGIEIKKDYTFDEIISTEISNLSILEKIHLRIASCLGAVFYKDIYKKLLGKNFNNKIFSKLMEKGYLQISNNNISFKYNIIQEAIYKEIPEKLRKKNHKKIGQIMEKFFKNKIEEYSPNLANHFYLAGEKEKAVEYSLKAGDLLFEKLAYPEAKYFYERAFNLYKNYNDKKFECALKFSKVLNRTGQPNESLKILKEIEKHTKKRKEILLNCKILKIENLKNLGDFSYIEDANNILKEIRNKKKKNHIKNLIAFALFRVNYFKEAIDLFKSVLRDKNNTFIEDITFAYTFLLNIYSIQKKYNQAHLIFKKAIYFAEKFKDFYQIIRLKIAYTGLLFEEKKVDEAFLEMKKLAKFSEEIGDYYFLASALLNIAKYLMEKNNLNESTKYLTEAKKYFEKTGNLEGLAHCFNLKGIVYFLEKKYQDAYENYLKAFEYFLKINERIEIMHVYYNLAEVCTYLNNKNEAFKWINEGLSSFKKEDNPKIYDILISLKNQIIDK